MQYLETLPKDDIKAYSHRLIRFYICYKKYRNTKLAIKRYTKIYGKRYEKEIGVVFTAVAQAAVKHAVGVRLPTGQDHFSPAKNKAIAGQKISRDRFIALIKDMDSEGLLTYRVGCRDHCDFDGGVLSELIFSNKLFDMLDIEKLTREVAPFDQPFIIVKDDDGNHINTKNMPGVGRTSATWTFMENWNSLLAETNITAYGVRIASPFYQKHYRNSVDGEGRNYVSGGGIQTMPKALRKGIKLKNEPCTLLDYKNLQVRLVYTLAGQPLDDSFDCYSVDHAYEQFKKEHRALCKSKMLAILYSKDEKAAISSVRATLREDLLVYPKAKKGSKWYNVLKPADPDELLSIQSELREDLAKKNLTLRPRKYSWLVQSLDQIQVIAKELIHLLSEKNHGIKDYFYQPELWKTLQNKESLMMDHVIKSLVDEGEPILTWHDGALTVTRLKTKLKKLMEEGFELVMGTSLNCVVDEEFSNPVFSKKAVVSHPLYTEMLPETEEETLVRIDEAKEDLVVEDIPVEEYQEDLDIWMTTTEERDRIKFVNGAIQNLYDWQELAGVWENSGRELTEIMVKNRDNIPIPF